MKKKTADKIKEIAILLFKKKGYDYVTIDEIIQAAGVTKSTFYYHFASKDMLLIDFYQSSLIITPEATRVIVTSDNYWEKLWACLEPTVDWAITAGFAIISRVIIINIQNEVDSLSISNDPEVANLYISIIAKGQKIGQFENRSDPIQLYHNLKNVSLGVVTQWCIEGGVFDYKNEFKNSITSLLSVKKEFFL